MSSPIRNIRTLEGINAHRRILVHGLPTDSTRNVMIKNKIEGVEQRIRDEP
jgi:pectate lyase